MTRDELIAAFNEQRDALVPLLLKSSEVRKSAARWVRLCETKDRTPEEEIEMESLRDEHFGRGTHELDTYIIPRIANAIAALSGGGK